MIDNDKPGEIDLELRFIIDAIFASRTVLIRVVRYLLKDLKAASYDSDVLARGEEEQMEIDTPHMPESLMSDAQPNSNVQQTLLEIYDSNTSPGCKRKRSMTHLGSISLSSILPPCRPTLSPFELVVTGRVIARRKKIGLGRLFSGMGVEEGCGRGVGSHVVGSSGSDEETDSDDEDDDLVIVMR